MVVKPLPKPVILLTSEEIESSQVQNVITLVHQSTEETVIVKEVKKV